MRGRVLILIGLIILGGIAVVAVLLLSGDDGGGETTATEEAGGTVDNGQPDNTTDSGNTGNPPPQQVELENVVIAIQPISRGQLITRELIAIEGEDASGKLIGIQRVPPNLTPRDANNNSIYLQDPLLLIGCRARTDIAFASPLVTGQLVPDPYYLSADLIDAQSPCAAVGTVPFGRIGSDAALSIPSDRVAIAVPVDPTGLGQVAYGLQPGDRVDVIMSFLFIDVDEEFQTRTPNSITVITTLPDGSIGFAQPVIGREEPSNIFEGVVIGPTELQQRPRLETQRTIQDAQVIWVGWFPGDGVLYGATPTSFEPEVLLDPTQQAAQGQQGVPPAAASPTDYIPVILTLAVTPQDALVLTWAIDSQIPVTYALRPAIADPSLNDPTDPVTLEYIINQFNLDPDGRGLGPPKLPIAVEPAVTDIRRFDLNSLRIFDLGTSQ